ncbi:hypothetical protein D3C73_1544720 [compost metagenome]
MEVGQLDGPVEQTELKAAFLRFKDGPGKFAHPDDGEAGLRHPAEVILPHLLRPMLRIIADAKLELLI